MKQKWDILIIVILLIFPYISCVSSNTLTPNRSGAESLGSYIRGLYNLDSILTDKPYILAGSGHHGYIWSIVYRDGFNYKFIQGTTRTTPPSYILSPFDTASIINNNIKTLTWAFDSLVKQNEDIQHNYRQIPSILLERFEIYNSNGELTFDATGRFEYYGEKAKKFGYKKGNLLYLLDWLYLQSVTDMMPLPSDNGPIKQCNKK